MITITQILVIIFGIIMLGLTLNQYRRRKLNHFGVLIWSSVWVILIAAVLLFDIIKNIALLIFNIQVFDFFVLGAIVIILVLIFLLNSSINENRKKIEEIVEEEALKKGKRKR